MGKYIDNLRTQPMPRPVLKRGDDRWDVKLLRRVLAEHGHGEPGWATAEHVPSLFDAPLHGYVRRFQASRKITVDGIVGPQTWAALKEQKVEPVRSLVRQAVVARAMELSAQEIREKRGKPNRGEPFDTWNKSAGVALGSPYCVSMWHREIGAVLAELDLDPPIRIGASTSLLYYTAKGAGRVKAVGQAEPGDLVLFRHGPKGKFYHTELIVAIREDGKFVTVGGNTDGGEDVQGEGTGVFQRLRTPVNVEIVDVLGGVE